jgi:hypothetical protein
MPKSRFATMLISAILAAATGCPAVHAAPPAPLIWFEPSYADITDLAESAPLVLRARIRTIAEVEPKRAIGVRPGWARIYVEATTQNLLAGPAAVGESLHYLADIKRDAKGKIPKLAKQNVLLFARPVTGHPDTLQLVAPDGHLPATAATESTLRTILTTLFAPNAPRRITGVHEAIFVPGTLVGEGESQIFLSTKDGEPAAITVQHHVNAAPHWSLSFSELARTADEPPARDSLVWYRLACFLPATLPAGVNVSANPADAAQAEADYRQIIADLGPCQRNRTP